jgi:hypothetical protein
MKKLLLGALLSEEDRCKLALEKGFKYDKDTGDIFNPRGKKIINNTLSSYTQIEVRVNSKVYKIYAHRFAWYVVYNELPDLIDHIDKVKCNNKISNLRNASTSINQLNRNSKGYYFCKTKNKFRAKIMMNRKFKHLGYFEKEEDAKECYEKYKNNLINN